MGTNYYFVTNDQDDTDTDDLLHLGKRSAGWRFLFRAHQDPKIGSVRELTGFLENTPGRIIDEYHGPEDTVEWLRMAVEWGRDDGHRHRFDCWCGPAHEVAHGPLDELAVMMTSGDYVDEESDTDWCPREFF